MRYRISVSGVVWLAFAFALLAQEAPPQAPPARVAPPPAKRVVEEIIARVNNEIVTLTDLRRAREAITTEVDEECRNCSPQEKAQRLEEREKNLLRDLIDQQLMVQRAKDIGINVEPDVIKRLDEIRQRNNLPDLEALQREVEKAGLNWEDFKNNIRNGLLTQELVSREVRRDIFIDKQEIQEYYEKHKSEFERPETVCLSELFVSTVDKPEAELPALEAKAKRLRERVVAGGEDFYELAKRYSDGDTAKQGGELGCFKRGELAKEIEEKVFKMNRNELTDVVRTKQGYIVLKVEQRYEAGIQPLEKVEGEIANRLMYQKLPPKLRQYLAKLREESFVVVKPGYVDTAAVATTPIVEVEAADEEDGKKKKKKKDKSE